MHDSPTPGARRRLAPPVRFAMALGLLVVVGATLAACGRREPATEDTPVSAETPVEVLVARDRAAAYFAQESLMLAHAALEPIRALEDVEDEDLLRLAIIELEVALSVYGVDEGYIQRAEALLTEAVARMPDDPRPHYALAQYHKELGNFEAALPLVERAAELSEGDAPTAILLGTALEEVGLYAEDDDEVDAYLRRAEQVYRDELERGIEFLGSWAVSLTYRLSRVLLQFDEFEESNDLALRRRELVDRDGVTAPNETQIRRGNFGSLEFTQPQSFTAAPGKVEIVSVAPRSLPDGLRTLRARTLTERMHSISIADVDPNVDPSSDLDGLLAGNVMVDGFLSPATLVGDDGRSVYRIDASGSADPWFEGDAEIAAWCTVDVGEDRGRTEVFQGSDLEGRPYLKGKLKTAGNREFVEGGVEMSDLELVVASAGRLLLVAEELDAPLDLGTYPGTLEQLLPVDIDHDGDVDLLGVGDRGLHLWRHDGAEGLLGVALGPDAEAGGWTPASEQFGPVASRDLRWVVTEDFDTDGDVDLLAGGPGGALWLSSDRNERWSDRSAALPSDFDASRPPVVDDFDANGFADLWEPATGRLLGDSYGDGFELAASLDPVPSGSDPKSLDLDLDGVVDLVWLADGTLHALLAPGFEARTPWSYADTRIPERGPFVLDDVEREGRWEFHTASGTVRFGGPSGVRLGLRGLKDNPRGIGAVVHVRSGRGYRRIYYRGEPVLVGTGPAGSANVIRVVWPNGVVQSQLDAPDGQRRVLVQIEGLVGSCPFLYTWNGETFEFISDVIGITPLGLPMAPGILVPPDHDEYVLVSGEQLVSKEDGSLVLQFTEELREVTYLDAVELVAVDHPVGTEVFPTERFSFPPFPEAHTHLVEPTSPVLAALDDQGRDWSASLAATDGDLAEPFESYRGQWLGLATPHTLELHFDAAAVRSAERLRLLMCGWLYWTDASVNVAAARHPGYEFVPPVLQVPDGAGGWRDAGPPVGFPAGKTKTMVLDVTGMIDPEDPRIRVFSTLRLFWDSIRLATDGDDAPRRETRLAVSKAELYERGFSQPIFLGGDQRLEWFDWDRLASAPRWNQHPGDYTRFGSVQPLLDAIDDKFVIMGSGDALELIFDGKALPELPEGWRRDYLVFLDGWAKDRDPNTYGAEHVEPLPFHGMSGYPYGADEAYPDDEEHRRYRREWNTRPAKRWIPSLVGGPLADDAE